MIGSMGLASSFALGVAKSNPGKKVIILDGDGSFLMNLGSSTCIGYYNSNNIIHIVLDNFSVFLKEFTSEKILYLNSLVL